MKISNGCWTCRLRRKRCDEAHPACANCASLRITCHYGQRKPEWLDGGEQERRMMEQLKQEIKGKRSRRSESHPGEARNASGANQGDPAEEPRSPTPQSSNACAMLDRTHDGVLPASHGSLEISSACPARPRVLSECTLAREHTCLSPPLEQSETVLVMFFLEQVFSSLFPFYRPSVFQGGKAWILELVIKSPVIKQAVLCQSSYLFLLMQKTERHDSTWETVTTQMHHAFQMLRQALQVLAGAKIADHLHGAVRVLASIIQLQRFEVAVPHPENGRTHLNAAAALFTQILGSPGIPDPSNARSSFRLVMERLTPSAPVTPVATLVQSPSAEQTAFCFSSSILLVDDIVSSTMSQEEPTLFAYHNTLLKDDDSAGSSISLAQVVGSQNWAFLYIGEIATLDAWKQRCRVAGSLDAIELVARATSIMNALKLRLTKLENDTGNDRSEGTLSQGVSANGRKQSVTSYKQSHTITRIWGHAALVYLHAVVSGLQPASGDVRHHVGCVVELLTLQLEEDPSLLRAFLWPFIVTGCLAELMYEARLRRMVELQQESDLFGKAQKALSIMENVWCSRELGSAAYPDLAACFRSHGEMYFGI